MEPHEAVEYRVWKALQAARDKRHIEERDADESKARKSQQVARNERYREEREYKSQAGEISTDKRDLTEREETCMKERKADRCNSWRAREEEERYTKEKKADRYDSWRAKEEREERYKERKADRYDSWRAREEEREERYMKERKVDRYDLRQAREVEREERYKEKPDRVRKITEENPTPEEHRRKSTLSHKRRNAGVETEKGMLTWEQREQIRFQILRRKKDFVCFERINGKIVNILEGLELHTGVFSAKEQMCIVDLVYELQNKGRRKELGEYTHSRPKKWMRGKGRETIQFGCCYNYAAKNGNLPGILQNVVADPLPRLFRVMIKRMVRWHVLPTSCVPDSCIVNIYDPEDCIPPHIDSHDFVRPFCTVSFLSECDIIFGSELKIAAPGEFVGSFAVPLPVGSVLVLNGNGADVAKHCVPAVRAKRISITFRKMDEKKRPTDFVPEADLQNIQPLAYDVNCIEEIQKKAVNDKGLD